MSTLWMIRHGQANFGQIDYDQLTDLGFEQSRILGEYWAERGQKFDAVYTGGLRRQEQTLEAVKDVYGAKGLELPDTAVDKAFSEYEAGGIWTKFFPILLKKESRLQEVIKQLSNVGSDSPTGRKAFQEAFGIVMTRWVEGDTGVEGVESWAQFQDRVKEGIKRIMAKYSSGKTIVVFTSGGAISMAMQWALGTSDKVGLELSWVVKNVSITEFMFNADRFSLRGFNLMPHISDEKLVTYR